MKNNEISIYRLLSLEEIYVFYLLDNESENVNMMEIFKKIENSGLNLIGELENGQILRRIYKGREEKLKLFLQKMVEYTDTKKVERKIKIYEILNSFKRLKGKFLFFVRKIKMGYYK